MIILSKSFSRYTRKIIPFVGSVGGVGTQQLTESATKRIKSKNLMVSLIKSFREQFLYLIAKVLFVGKQVAILASIV